MSHHDQSQSSGGEEVRDIRRAPMLLPLALLVGVGGLGAAVALGYNDPKRLALAYVTGYAAFLTVTVCALFFVIIQHLTRAGWSATIRRVAEVVAANIVTMIVLALPIFIFSGTIYHWVHPGDDVILQSKAAWLNQPFWIGRMLLYMGVWTAISWWLWGQSLKQDKTGDVVHTEKMQNIAGLLAALFAITAYFGFTDLLMTLDPHWFSTMFGVYCFAGGFLNFFAVMILLLRQLQRSGLIRKSVNREHFHDLGKFMFAFVFFWSYVGFSQWMLIWYGNMPEETYWFANRGVTTNSKLSAGVWGPVALMLLFGHCFIPFAGQLSRWSKRILGLLQFWALWMFTMHFVDMFWLVMPEVNHGEVGEAANIYKSLLLAALCWVGVGGIWLAGFALLARRGSLVPLHDPRLHEAVAYEVY